MIFLLAAVDHIPILQIKLRHLQLIIQFNWFIFSPVKHQLIHCVSIYNEQDKHEAGQGENCNSRHSKKLILMHVIDHAGFEMNDRLNFKRVYLKNSIKNSTPLQEVWRQVKRIWDT